MLAWSVAVSCRHPERSSLHGEQTLRRAQRPSARRALRAPVRSAVALADVPSAPDLDGVHLPTDPGQVVQGAARALVAGAMACERRLQCQVLLPGVHGLVEDTVPFSEQLLIRLGLRLGVEIMADEAWARQSLYPLVRLVFLSEGTAAVARAIWQQQWTRWSEPLGEQAESRLSSRSLATRVSSPVDWGDERAPSGAVRRIVVFMAPQNRRGLPVVTDIEKAMRNTQADDATVPADAWVWVLLNPLLVDQEDNVALSIREIDRRRAFVRSFIQAYTFRPLYRVQRPSMRAVGHGLLWHTYAQPWRVFGCAPWMLPKSSAESAALPNPPGGYRLLGEYPEAGRHNVPPDDALLQRVFAAHAAVLEPRPPPSPPDRTQQASVALAWAVVALLVASAVGDHWPLVSDALRGTP